MENAEQNVDRKAEWERKSEREWYPKENKLWVDGIVNRVQLQCVSCSCVCECFWEEVSRNRNFCYFWFSFKNYCTFIGKFLIKSQFKWFGKRWQWIPCESFRFYCVNWSIRKYVVSEHEFFFRPQLLLLLLLLLCFLLLLLLLSRSLSTLRWFSCCVFFLRIQRTFTAHTLAHSIFRSICTRVVIKHRKCVCSLQC